MLLPSLILQNKNNNNEKKDHMIVLGNWEVLLFGYKFYISHSCVVAPEGSKREQQDYIIDVFVFFYLVL